MTLVVSPMFPVWSVTYVPGLYRRTYNYALKLTGALECPGVGECPRRARSLTLLALEAALIAE